MDQKNEKNIERASSSSKKFNTELFNIPFTNIDNNINNISNNSIISQHSNNDISFQNVSFQKSANSSKNNITEDKKRKPFDNLHFLEKNADNMNNFEDSINSINTSNINSEKRLNISDSLPKSNAETEITTNKITNKNNVDNQENAINTSKLSDLNKSSLMKTQSALNKDIVEKALKYNKANDKENCPFWVKFFLEENNLKQNSSYFKAKDKDLYIKTMLEITKNDAKLEEKTNLLKEKKEKTFFELKKLLLTEIKEENKFEEEKLNHLEEDSKISQKKENNSIQPPTKNKKENLVNLLSKYTDSNKKDMYFDKQIDLNYYDYIKKQKELEESNNYVQKNIKNASEIVLLNKYSHAKSHVLNKEEIYKNEDTYIGIDQLDFDKENYDNVHFRYYGKNTIKSLMEIDKKLEKLNPTHSNYSTKNDLKYMKEACKKPISKNTIKANPINDKYTNQTKKNKNEDKYIDRNSDIRVKRELKSRLNEIDTKLLLNQRQEFDTKKIEDFIDEFNKAKYGDPSEREKDLNFKIPEEAIFNKMDEQFEDCDRRIKEIKKQIADKLKIEQELEKFEKENLNKPKELSQEEIAYEKKLDKLLICLENEEKNTNNYLSGLDSIQTKIIEENKNIDLDLDKVQDLIRKNDKEYDNIFDKYEAEIELKYAEEENNNEEFEEEKGADYYYKLYEVEDIIHHDYKNDINMNKSFQNDLEMIKNREI